MSKLDALNLPTPDYRSEDGTVYLYRADCLDVLPQLPDGAVDAVVTDPPYGIAYQHMNGSGGRGERSGVLVKWEAIDGDECVDGRWLADAYRICVDGGACYLNTRWDVEPEWRAAAADAGWTVKQRLIWHHMAHGKGDLKGTWAPDYEDILFLAKGRHVLSSRPPAVIQVTRVPTWEIRHHPHQKPVGLPLKLIETSQSQTVLEPFAGSGSTLVACAKLGVCVVGIEKKPEYFDTSVRRIEQAFADQSLFAGVNT